MYSFSGKSAASAAISTFMCLWAIYIVPGSVYNTSTYFLQQNRRTDGGNIWITHRRLNLEIGTETLIFLFWEYLFRNFCILSLQCIFTTEAKRKRVGPDRRVAHLSWRRGTWTESQWVLVKEACKIGWNYQMLQQFLPFILNLYLNISIWNYCEKDSSSPLFLSI
jgi:hypothetical protein